MTEPFDDPSAVPQARPVSVVQTTGDSGAATGEVHSLGYASPVMMPFSRWMALLDLVLLGVLTFGVMFVVQGGVMLAEAGGLINDTKTMIPWMSVVIGVLTMGVVFAIVALRRHPMASIGWTSAELGMNLTVGVALWASIMIVSIMFIMVLGLFSPEAFEDFTQARTRIEGVFPRISIPMILLMSLVIAFYEEILFRGIVLTRLSQMLRSPTAAVIVSSLVFGSMHFYEGYSAAIMITILGFIFAVCTVWRKSLVAAIVAHFLFNSFQLIMLYVMSDTWE